MGWWGLKAMVEKSHSGLSAGLFIAYLLSVGLNLSCLWFALKKVLSLFKLCAAPTHSEFTSTLMSCLKPEILERGTPPNPMGKDGNVEGCIVLCNHVNWSDFVLDIVFLPKGVYVSRQILKLVFFPGSFLRPDTLAAASLVPRVASVSSRHVAPRTGPSDRTVSSSAP